MVARGHFDPVPRGVRAGQSLTGTWGAEGAEQGLRQPQSSPAPRSGSFALLGYRRIHLRAVGWKGQSGTEPGTPGPSDAPRVQAPPGTGLGSSNALGTPLWAPAGHWDHTLASSLALGPCLGIQFCPGILPRTQECTGTLSWDPVVHWNTSLGSSTVLGSHLGTQQCPGIQ